MPTARCDITIDRKPYLSALRHSSGITGKNMLQFYRLDKELFNTSGFIFTMHLCVMVHNESLVSPFCFLYKQLSFIMRVGGIPKSTCVFLVSAAHNSSSEAASCSVMVLVYFGALCLVTFHSSLVLRSRVVGKFWNTETTKTQRKSKSKSQSVIDCI